MTIENISFDLSKSGQNFGQINWQREKKGLFWVEKSGRITGAEQAVSVLSNAIKIAIQEKMLTHSPRPTMISDPLTYLPELVTVLQNFGFDVPDVLRNQTISDDVDDEHICG